MASLSLLQKLRLQYKPKLPQTLSQLNSLKLIPGKSLEQISVNKDLESLFPHNLKQTPFVTFTHDSGITHKPIRVGVVFSGGQAPGGHNVITGLFDALKKLHPESRLFGFLDGPKGIIDNKNIELTAEKLALYRNQGGFDLIGSGRTKIETLEQFKAAEATARSLDLDGMVIIGGDDSNTNAALLAEYFIAQGCKTKVVGDPKTIDGDLANADIEIPFGFDTATKTYSETIGSIMQDNLSAKKYYYFIKLMGRSASHIALECTLKTHPNIAFIGEEIAANKITLKEITQKICDVICERAVKKKDHGVILIPEGIIEFIPEFQLLISDMNSLLDPNKPHVAAMEQMASHEDKEEYMARHLSQEAASCFRSLPRDTKMQLMLDRDPHGNVQVSKIETERLLIETVKAELKKRQKEGTYGGKFSPQPYFCGYEGRSCLPSNFDAQYCYVLGHVAALLVNSGATGYICCVQGLSRPVEEWKIGGRSLTTMMKIEKRLGKEKPVIEKSLVDLHGKSFELLKSMKERWAMEDDYCNPGPIQFFGPEELTDTIPLILKMKAASS